MLKCGHVSLLQVNVFKKPITDPGKNSKKGRLTLELQNGKFVTIQEGKGDTQKVRLFEYLFGRSMCLCMRMFYLLGDKFSSCCNM